jgi:hypothetical protein
MRFIWLLGVLQVAAPAYAAPPPNASGQYSDWFQSLTVPGNASLSCYNAADCRMVDSRWNAETQRYEASLYVKYSAMH